jgi:hypothetical protein
VGRRTLPIYLLHLTILYDGPWNPGFNRLFDKCLPLWPSMSAALLMQVVMISSAVAYGKIRFDKLHAKLTVPQSADKPH